MSQKQKELIQQDILSSESNDNEIDLIGLIQTLGEHKWLLFGLPFLCSCIAAVISLYLTPMYTAKSTFIVPADKQSSAASAILEQAGAVGGIASSLSKSPTEMYIAIMQSNKVQDEIITELGLMHHYQTKTQEDTRKKLLSLVKITADKKSGLITLEAQDRSPDFSAKLANAYLKPFRALLNSMSIEEAHLRRDFFAQQIAAIAQRPFRDPVVQSTLMSSMIRQYESARIDQGRESQILFLVDIAKSPEKKSSPRRSQLVLIVGLATFFLTALWFFIKSVFYRFQSDPVSSHKWALMKKAWKLRT
jgi:capsular polysaccharide biosynthesis protein